MDKYLSANLPPVDDIDIPALTEKYRQERDKRIREMGSEQYIESTDDFSATYEVDPYLPMEQRDPVTGQTDVVILGAGYSGIAAAIQLKKAGVEDFYTVDHAGDFGGVWYWNRFPGLQCDNDAYCYMPFLEETNFVPSKKYTDGHEILQHCQLLAKQFELYGKALFHTLIETLRWDEDIKCWRVGTNRGDDIKARFVVLAMGPINKPKFPGIPGIRDFKGKMFHTARWDYGYTGGDREHPVLDKLADKTVAIVGTGATAIQVIPYLGKYAKQLYVIQRTPSCVDQRNNAPTDVEWFRSLKPGWQQDRIRNFHRAGMERLEPGEPDLVGDIWTEISRNLSAEFDEIGWPTTMEAFMARRDAMDFQVMERLRRRVDQVVEDKATAEALKPYYRFMCKRPCSSDVYYPTFNRPNVKLIDVSGTRGLEKLTESGFVHDGVEREIDCIVFASGYEVTSELRRRWGIDAIEGRDGLPIYDYWKDGFKTLHGTMACKFPNLFFTGYIQGGVNASTTATFLAQGRHIGYIVSEALKRGAAIVEPSQDAQDAWVSHVRETAVDMSEFAKECTPGYYFNEGEQKLRFIFGESYGPGFYAFENILQQWRANGKMEGLMLDQSR
jgi:cation diffusion facilitator CzcD-associated flavoprotein CzcO